MPHSLGWFETTLLVEYPIQKVDMHVSASFFELTVVSDPHCQDEAKMFACSGTERQACINSMCRIYDG